MKLSPTTPGFPQEFIERLADALITSCQALGDDEGYVTFSMQGVRARGGVVAGARMKPQVQALRRPLRWDEVPPSELWALCRMGGAVRFDAALYIRFDERGDDPVWTAMLREHQHPRLARKTLPFAIDLALQLIDGAGEGETTLTGGGVVVFAHRLLTSSERLEATRGFGESPRGWSILN